MNSTINKIAVLQCYIHCMTDKEVEIRRPVNIEQELLLNTAYTVAANWVNNNNIKLTLLR